LSVELLLAPNQFKHDQELVLRYRDVSEFSVAVTSAARAKNVWPESRRLGDLQLDEVLPHDKGCSHEIQFTGGVIRLVAADLDAEWRESADPVDDAV
jgi:hypothetical protein